MNECSDAELLERFAQSASDEAFGALVQRHVNLVYSVALRHTANTHHAEEISQAVFMILARKARSLKARTILPGWLYHTARLTAANFQRMEQRRVRRENEAFMRSILDETPSSSAWQELAPLLDEAMARLREVDRDALVLRYFENKTLQETGNALGIEERAAQKRVTRALEKLRCLLLKHGVLSTSSAIAALISTHSLHGAPAALASSIAATALEGSAVSASTLTLIKGTCKIMAWTKAKTTAAVGLAMLLGTAGTLWVKRTTAEPAVAAIQQANTGLPEAQTRAKMLVMFAMSQKRVPEASSWCDTLNANGKLWPVVPTNTLFAINRQAAGRAYSRQEIVLGKLPGDTVLFFETGKQGWNQAGGTELLPAKADSVAVAFADGSASIVPRDQVAQLRWKP